MIKPELEFVYEAGGELDAPREIGKVVDGTRRIIPIRDGGYVKGPRISGKLMGNSADWQLTRPDGVTVADAIYAIETDDGVLIQIRNKGLRHGPAEVMDRLRRGEEVDPGEYYFRTALRLAEQVDLRLRRGALCQLDQAVGLARHLKQAGNRFASRWLFPEKRAEEVHLRKITIPVAILTLGLAACGSPEPAEEPADETAMDTATPTAAPMEAVAMLQTAEGEPAGTATATASGESIAISLQVEGLPPGEHGVHIHMTGTCEAPTFESAGEHWNPTNQQHGLEEPAGQHAGDMPNLTVGDDGSGTLEYQLAGGTFDGLMDADGSAFVVHAMPDDQVTDPSGNSGDRIACGAFSAS